MTSGRVTRRCGAAAAAAASGGVTGRCKVGKLSSSVNCPLNVGEVTLHKTSTHVGLPKSASAGNRTRIDCLEGNHANRYTTDAVDNLNP